MRGTRCTCTEASFDALRYEVLDVAAVQRGVGADKADGFPIAAVEGEGHEHPLAVPAVDLEHVGAPGSMDPLSSS